MMSRDAGRLGRPLGERLNGALRPSVEALLLAAVALGCAQAGWTLLSPGPASATVTAGGDTPSDAFLETADVRSPFAPDASDAAAHAVNATLSSIQLNGLRMASDPTRSGAMFTLPDGGQRAFLVGQEVVDGVVLGEVGVGYVSLSYAGGERRLEMTAASAFSFARAMMGLEPAPGAPVLTSSVDASATSATISTADRAWLARTLMHVEAGMDGTRGWRLADALPEAVASAGLRAGDLVISVNGQGAEDLAAAVAAASASQVVLEIERGGARHAVTLDVGGSL